MDRIETTETRDREPCHAARSTTRVRIVLPPSFGNASLLPLPLPESLWPTDAEEPRGESSPTPGAMFVPRVSMRSVLVAAALALTFVGCARSTLEVGDPLAAPTTNWCALDGEGNAACWGSAYAGAARPRPMESKFVDVATVGTKKCGIALDGSLSCASTGDADATAMGNEYTSLSASSTQMCALRADGTAECWGQLGPTAARPRPRSEDRDYLRFSTISICAGLAPVFSKLCPRTGSSKRASPAFIVNGVALSSASYRFPWMSVIA